MLKLPKNEVSYWTKTTQSGKYPKLTHDLEIDVAIVGGGIAGLTAAYMLKKEGLKITVLEKGELGGMVSGHTTGKVTSQHNLIYEKLEKKFGPQKARLYGEANQGAIERIEQIIKNERISCDWQRDDNYVYTEKVDEVQKLKQEARTAKKLGLPASFVTKTPLPFKVAGAVRFSSQAKMHSRKYILGLAKAINGQGSQVFENTEVKRVRNGNPCTVKVKDYRISAKDVIIATNVPFPKITHGLYCALEYPLQSYIVAAKIKTPLSGMYIAPSNPLNSILPIRAGKDNLLLIGGESHLPISQLNSNKYYQKLADFGEERFELKKIDYRWKAFDYLAYDDIPLIGRLYPWTKHVYVTTAFLKWGLSTSMVSAVILKNMITGQQNLWQSVFDSRRISPITSIPNVIKKTLSS